MSLADRIAVMNYAVLQQYDTPHNIYNYPRNLFVANFIGSPTINFFEGEYQNGGFVLNDFSKGEVSLSQNRKSQVDSLLKNSQVVVGIRPEHLKVSDEKDDKAPGLKGKVASFEPLGSKTIVYLHPDADTSVILKSAMPSGYRPKIGDVKHLQFSERSIYLFDKQSTELVVRFGREERQ
jgi:multiple sugar transport system ATP-binding protein